MLTPKFEGMPQELRHLSRWVTHRAKCPYDPSRPRSKASVTDPLTWGSFSQAVASYDEGGCDGVGFVLAADGVVGIDLDHVVFNGVPKPAALELLEGIGAQFVELSPSATGLHAWGRWPEPFPGRRGRLNDISIEVYSRERYLTMTGYPLPGRGGPLAPLNMAPLFDRLGSRNATPQRTPEDNRGVQTTLENHLLSSVGCSATTPRHEGERNRCLFELARRLKATKPNANDAERRALVQEWLVAHYATIRTKSLAVSLDDFERAWGSVKFIPGHALNSALDGVNMHAPLPPALAKKGYGPFEAPLLHVCAALQDRAGDEPFFITSRVAASLLGHIDHSTAAAMLRQFVRDGVLQLVSKGSGRIASRYRMQDMNADLRGAMNGGADDVPSVLEDSVQVN